MIDDVGKDVPLGDHHGGIRTMLHPETHETIDFDPVSRVLKWVLLATAVACFAIIFLATRQQYRDAPQLPDHFLTLNGGLVMSGENITAGKAGFQKADLIDYGSLYGMGSYFGPDYTADTLVALATAVQDDLAQATTGMPFASLDTDRQASIQSHMQTELRAVDLTRAEVTVSTALAGAIAKVREAVATKLLQSGSSEGYSKARSLDAESARQTADFMIYSALTTVAHRPGSNISWTQNWPYEPIVGNTPTTSTFIWTWVSFCFVFFGFGGVLAIYKIFLSDPDVAPMDPVLTGFQACNCSPV